MDEKEGTKNLGDSWVDLERKSSPKKTVEVSRESDVEKLIAEATSGEESDTQITPNTSSVELKAMPTSPLPTSLLASKGEPLGTHPSHQSSRPATPPKEFELHETSPPNEPIFRTLCVLIPVIVCSHLAFFAIGYYLGRRSVDCVRF